MREIIEKLINAINQKSISKKFHTIARSVKDPPCIWIMYKQLTFIIFRFGLQIQQMGERHEKIVMWPAVTHSPERKRGGEKIGWNSFFLTTSWWTSNLGPIKNHGGQTTVLVTYLVSICLSLEEIYAKININGWN